MTDRELFEQALDALEHLQTDVEWQYKSPTRAMLRKIEKALRARLAQPEREWVGLTGYEVNECAAGCHNGNSVQDAIRKAEAKLREKNG